MENKDNYDRLKSDPTETNNRLVNDTIKRMQKQKMMKEKVAKGLKTKNHRTLKFYLRPNIHKKGNPGHEVLSSVNCHTSNISKYVDYHLQDIVEEISSYVKNTKDFIQKPNQIEEILKDSLLVTLDINSLYITIPKKEGIK